VEDTSSGNPIVAPTGATTDITTIWIDGNSTYGTTYETPNSQFGSTAIDPVPFSSENYNIPFGQNPITTMRAAAAHSYTMNGTDMVAQVSNIIVRTNKSCNIYCRIGLPMIDNYSFDYVSLSLSS
jgi:hypothetical protein